MIFLQRLSELIQLHGITKNKLFSTLGINRNSFVDWEKHNSIPNGEVLAKIADYFGVSVDYLLGQEEESERATDFLPERLRKAIEEIGCEEFYQRFHYNPKIISDYLEGKRKPLNATLFQIATDLDVNPEWLYGRDVPKYKKPTPVSEDGLDDQDRQLMELMKLLTADQKEFLRAQLLTLTGRDK